MKIFLLLIVIIIFTTVPNDTVPARDGRQMQVTTNVRPKEIEIGDATRVTVIVRDMEKQYPLAGATVSVEAEGGGFFEDTDSTVITENTDLDGSFRAYWIAEDPGTWMFAVDINNEGYQYSSDAATVRVRRR